MSNSVGRIDLDMGLNYKAFKNDLNGIVPKTSTLVSGAFGKLGILAAGAFSAKALFGFGKGGINLASDLIEVQNVVDVTFGNMAQSINNFAKESLASFGLSELSAKKYTSTMGAMLKSSGLMGPTIKDMSIELTKLSADMASFYNLSNEVAFNKIRAGISGETEPLKQLGINMNVANLEAYALSQGIKKTYNQMSQAEQVLLRYNYLMKVSADSQGDFARNADTWANQIKVLGEQWRIFQGTMGAGFMNILTPMIKGINLLIAKLQIAANYFKAFTELIFGKKGDNQASKANEAIANSADDAADAMGGVGKATKKAGKEAKNGLMPFDEVNNMMEDAAKNADDMSGSMAGGVDFGELSVGKMDLGEDEILTNVENLINSIKEKFVQLGQHPLGLELKTSFGNVLSEIEINTSSFIENIKSILSSIKMFGEEIFPPIAQAVSTFTSLAITFFEGFATTAISVFSSIIEGVTTILSPGLELISSIIITVFDSINEFLSIHSESIRTVIMEGWSLINIGITTIVNIIAQLLVDIFGGLLTWWQENSNAVKETLLFTWETIWLGISTIWNILYEIGLAIFEGLKTFFTANSQKIAEVITSAWNLIWTVVSGLWNVIMLTANIVFTALKNFWDKWGSDVLEIFDIWWTYITALFGVVLDIISGTFNIFAKLFLGDWEGAWEESKKAGEKIWNGIMSMLSSVWDLIKKIAQITWKAIADYALEKWNAIITGITNLKNKMVSSIKEPFEIARDWINNLIKEAYDWGRNMVDNIVSGIKSAVGKVKDAVSNVGNTIKDFLGFSSPTKKGPGSTADEWMPNFMGMLSDGIYDNMSGISRAIRMTSDELTSLSHIKPLTPELSLVSGSTRTSSNNSIDLNDTNFVDKLLSIITTAIMAAKQFEGQSSNNPGNIEIELVIDGVRLGRVLLPRLNQEADRLGYKPILQIE